MWSKLKSKLVFSKTLLMQLIMWAALFACVSMATMLFFAGRMDGKEAVESGRRIELELATGKLIGKENKVAVAAAQPEAEKPKEEEKPAEAPKEEPKVEEPKPEESKPEEPKTEEQPKPAEPAAAEKPKEEEVKPGEELPMSYTPEEPAAPSETVTIVPAAEPLPNANEKLIEKKEIGHLPVISGDGIKPWHYYAKPFERKGKQPMVAIIVAGLGHSKYPTEKALALPQVVTLSLSPYPKNVKEWANTARLTAHETLIDLAMQPGNYPATDPGPYGLVLDKGLQENENRLQWHLSRFTGAIGVLAPQNEIYMDNDESLKALLQSLANRGVMLVLGREPPKSETKEILETSSTPNVIVDMLIDEELLDMSIDTRLDALEQLAQKRGYAVGMISATPLSLDRLKLWIDGLEAKGIQLAPVSAVAKLRFS